MATKLTRKSIILAKVEANYGTDVNPTANDAMRISNLSVTPLAARTVEREFYRQHLGSVAQLVVGQSVELSFDVELAGSGSAVTPPPYADLLKACALGETIKTTNNAESVSYKPVSSGFKSVTIYYYADGTKHAVTGARGNLSANLSPGSVPTLTFTMTGRYTPPTDENNPVASYTRFKNPVPISKESVVMTLHGHAVNVHSFDIDLGTQTSHQDIIGRDEVLITDRGVSGNVTIDLTSVNTKNWVELVRLGTLGELRFDLGGTAGNKVQISGPKVQMITPSHADTDGVRTISMGLRLLPNAGNDEVILTTK